MSARTQRKKKSLNKRVDDIVRNSTGNNTRIPIRRVKTSRSRNRSEDVQPTRTLLRSRRVEGVSQEEADFQDTVGMALYSYTNRKDGYEIGGDNPYYTSKKERASRVKSSVPKKIPIVTIRPGPIKCPFDYDEMKNYYLSKQRELTSHSSNQSLTTKAKLLQELELKFIYTFPSPPIPEDFRTLIEYRRASNDWLFDEDLRITTGQSPFCSVDASRYIKPIDFDEEWLNKHKNLIDDYEDEVKKNLKK